MKTQLYGVRVITVEYFRVEATSEADVRRRFNEGFDSEPDAFEDYYINEIHVLDSEYGEIDEAD